MLRGKVIKAAGGFFTVCAQNGRNYICRARGALKRNKQALIVGDRVLFKPGSAVSDHSNSEGVVEKVLPRSSCMPRPPVANVDLLVIIMSLKSPDCDWQLISRMTVLAEKENLTVIICLNKTDLISKDEYNELTDLIKPYPYPVIFTSALSYEGVNYLKEHLSGQCSVLAGPSGVGKSTLLNCIQPGLALQTGEVSEKIGRGKHTTRQVSLLPLEGGGSVVDTPGFSRLDFPDIAPGELADYFPEIESLRGYCGFRDCRHISEPKCVVKQELGKTVNPMRYDHYQYFFNELDKREAY